MCTLLIIKDIDSLFTVYIIILLITEVHQLKLLVDGLNSFVNNTIMYKVEQFCNHTFLHMHVPLFFYKVSFTAKSIQFC